MRLRRSDPESAGITRRRRGKGFSYHLDGQVVTDPETLERIKALVIPPAWRRVWISRDPRGHLQAVGVDAAGRKQYLYHAKWRTQRDRAKFDHMLEVAAALPALHRRIAGDLRGRGLIWERVLAAAVRMLDSAALRIGGESYAQDDPVLGDATFGLATLLREHVRVRGDVISFSFPGKGAAPLEFEVADAALADVVGSLAVSLARGDPPTGVTAERRAIAQAMRDVAERLGNTPAVARKSYVDARLLDHFRDGTTIDTSIDTTDWAQAERAVLELLGGDDATAR